MRPQDDQAVVLFANIVDDAQTLTVNMDLADYGLDCTAAQVIVRGPSGIIDEGSPWTAGFSKGTWIWKALRGGQAWEFIPVDQKRRMSAPPFTKRRAGIGPTPSSPTPQRWGADVTSFVAQLKDSMQADPSIQGQLYRGSQFLPGDQRGWNQHQTDQRKRITVDYRFEFVVITFEEGQQDRHHRSDRPCPVLL